jgi:serine/threonine-protein kinase
VGGFQRGWDEGNADISPDGRWLAYHSDETGEPRIYVHSFPVKTGKQSVSPAPGTDPVWSPGGRRLYYRSGSQFFVVDVTTEPAFSVSVPDLLFDEPRYTRQASTGWSRNWDVHPDGDRFIMVGSEVGDSNYGGGPAFLDDLDSHSKCNTGPTWAGGPG